MYCLGNVRVTEDVTLLVSLLRVLC